MTRPHTPADDEAIPVGSEADEEQDGTVLSDSSAAVDEDALADAGLPRDGSGQMVVPGSDRRVSLAHRLYNGEAGLDVVGHSRLIYKVTAVVVLLCVLSLVFRGFNFGIEFEGGDSFKAPGPAPSSPRSEPRPRTPAPPSRPRRSWAATPCCCAPPLSTATRRPPSRTRSRRRPA